MKITTALEVSKQEKNLIQSALIIYTEYLTKMLSDCSEGSCKALVNTTLTDTNRLLNEIERSL